ncbi:MAG: hypothetical protein GY826_18215, partial [Fuerstiella sp.]|nr:hypothetical protein [Fuerstiella sp.]
MVEVGTGLLADGLSSDSNWLRVVYGDVPGWVNRNALISIPDLDTLPVISANQHTPMQAFYFSTGIGTPSCNEAESALTVQSPENLSVNLSVNGVDIRVGSTVTFQSLAENRMRMTVHAGEVETVDGRLIPAGDTIIGRVDEEGHVLGWLQQRPATEQEQAAGERAQPILQQFSGNSSPEQSEQTVHSSETSDETVSETESGTGQAVHIVQYGENLFRIALNYDTRCTE